jgi:hypothetical protein
MNKLNNTDMKKLLFSVMALVIAINANSQNGLYISYENGGKLDNFHYINEKGYSLLD